MNLSEEFVNSTRISSVDFFATAFQNGPLKVCTMGIAIVCLMILIPTGYGMIWFEHYGSDKKRTLINRLFSSVCWTSMQYYVFVCPLEIARYIYGPLPEMVCLIHLIHKNEFPIQLTLFSSGVALSRYLFVFYLKNPSEFQDEFWHTFINIWIICFGFLSQFTYVYLPGHQPVNYYLCIGVDPQIDGKDFFIKRNYIAAVILLLSIIIQILVAVRFIIHRRHIDATSNYAHKENFMKEILSDFFISFGFFSMALVYGYLMLKTNSLKPALFNVYPNYLFLYGLHFALPLGTAFFFTGLFYVRNQQMRLVLFESLFDSHT